MMIERVIVGILLVAMLDVNVEAGIPLALFFGLGIFLIVKRPYKNNYNNVRAITNMTISVVVMAVYLAYRMAPTSVKNKSEIFFYLPLIICVLLMVCVLYNSAVLIYTIVTFFKSLMSKSYEDVAGEEKVEYNKIR